MDNASKALIMAGAILISVAIVGIGIYIFSTSNALTDDAVGQIDSLAVSSANSRIEQYVGKGVRGTQVIQLLNEINVINNTKAFPGRVEIDSKCWSSSGGHIGKVSENNRGYFSSSSNPIKDNGRYDVTVTEYDSNGYIKTLTVYDS